MCRCVRIKLVLKKTITLDIINNDGSYERFFFFLKKMTIIRESAVCRLMIVLCNVKSRF